MIQIKDMIQLESRNEIEELIDAIEKLQKLDPEENFNQSLESLREILGDMFMAW